MAQIIPAAAGYYTLNYTWGDRYPIVAWEVHDGHNNCHPIIPGPTDPEYHAIESPDGSVYDVKLDTCYRDKNEWKEACDNVVEEDPCYRPRPS